MEARGTVSANGLRDKRPERLYRPREGGCLLVQERHRAVGRDEADAEQEKRYDLLRDAVGLPWTRRHGSVLARARREPRPGVEMTERLAHHVEPVLRVAPPMGAVENVVLRIAHDETQLRPDEFAPDRTHAQGMRLRSYDDGGMKL